MSEQNKAIVRRWFDEVWNQKRAATIDALLAPNAVVRGLGPDQHGPADFKPFHTAYCDAFPDVSIQLTQIVAEGDMVAACWTGTATHQGDGLGFPATHRPVSFSGITMARLENGRLVEGWNSFNQLEMFQQLGVNPPMP